MLFIIYIIYSSTIDSAGYCGLSLIQESPSLTDWAYRSDVVSFLFPQEVTCQDQIRTQLETDSQLRIALQNARDAVVAEITASPATIDGSISADLNHVVRFLLLVGNRSDVEFLQQRATGEYKNKFATSRNPRNTFQTLRKSC